MRQRIEERPVNFVSVNIYTESGCNPLEGEYSLRLSSFIGELDLDDNGGNDDISLIKECIENNFDFSTLPAEGIVEIIMEETGEWEDVFWNKYYKIIRTSQVQD